MRLNCGLVSDVPSDIGCSEEVERKDGASDVSQTDRVTGIVLQGHGD
jgi:hypothetical protein